MDNELKSGVYRHKDGDFYQVLFIASLQSDVQKDDDVIVYINADNEDPTIHVVKGSYPTYPCGAELNLFTARAHADYFFGVDNEKPPIDVAVYVPLYSHKPGRRISVRAVSEFNERVNPTRENPEGVKRFTYVGDVIPEAK